jgi:glutamine synthetase
MNKEQALELLRTNRIRYVLAQFVDIHGSAKAKAVPVEHLDMVLTDGAGFAGFALWGFGMGPQGPDYMAVGELATLKIIPWMPGYARLVCNGTVKGKPWPYCSRVALQRQLDKLAAQGLTLYTGIEPEFMLLSRDATGRLGPHDPTDTLDKPCYDYKGLSRTSHVLDEMVDGLRAVGVDILTLGQYLRPTVNHLSVERFVAPEEFESYRAAALARGFLFRRLFGGFLGFLSSRSGSRPTKPSHLATWSRSNNLFKSARRRRGRTRSRAIFRRSLPATTRRPNTWKARRSTESTDAL